MDMERKQIRQGDLLFIPIDAVPPDFRPCPGRSVLAYGEVTGHAHRIAGLGETETAIYEGPDGQLIVDGGETTRTVPHEEHDAVVLSRLYRVIRQREYDPDEVARQRRVQD